MDGEIREGKREAGYFLPSSPTAASSAARVSIPPLAPGNFARTSSANSGGIQVLTGIRSSAFSLARTLRMMIRILHVQSLDARRAYQTIVRR